MNQLYWLFFYFFQKDGLFIFQYFGSIFLSLFFSLEYEAHVLQH